MSQDVLNAGHAFLHALASVQAENRETPLPRCQVLFHVLNRVVINEGKGRHHASLEQHRSCFKLDELLGFFRAVFHALRVPRIDVVEVVLECELAWVDACGFGVEFDDAGRWAKPVVATEERLGLNVATFFAIGK